MFRRVVFAFLVLAASVRLSSQVVPSAEEARIPTWSVGGAFSYVNPDLGHSRNLGGTFWLDRALGGSPFLRPIGIEFEARDLPWHTSSSTSLIRINTEQVGATYTFTPTNNFHQYIKVLVGRGDTDYGSSQPTWRATSLAGGLTYRVRPHIWIRAEYEYQIFPGFFSAEVSRTHQSAPLDPQGINLGAVYTFGRKRPVD